MGEGYVAHRVGLVPHFSVKIRIGRMIMVKFKLARFSRVVK